MFAASHKLRAIRRVTVGIVAVGALAASLAVPAMAAVSTVEVSVLDANPNVTLTAGDAVVFSGGASVNYSHTADQSVSGTIDEVTITDQRSSPTGWSVSIVASDLVDDALTLDASNVFLTGVVGLTGIEGSDPTGDLSGQPVSPVALDEEYDFLIAADGTEGRGEYTMDLGIRVDIPAQTKAGDYAGTLTLTATAGD